jgi:alpha-tubulin suppressor-like RCC1 family protein
MTKKTEEEQQSLPSSSSGGGGGSGSRRTSSDEEIAAIQSEIEQVEASYNTSSSSIPSSSPLRRATFNSVRDTLSNLHDRLMVHHHHHSQRAEQERNQQQSTVGQNNMGQNNGQQRRSILQQLSNRLSILDAAHSSRVPLQVMMMHRNGGRNSITNIRQQRHQGVPVVTDAPQQASLMNGDDNANNGIEVVLDGGSSGSPTLSSSRPAISVSVNVFSVSTRDLMSVGEGLLHHSNDDNGDDGLSSSPPAAAAATTTATSATGTTGSSRDSISRLGSRRSSVLFASRIVAHQSVRDGSSNVLLASVSSTAVASASATGQQTDGISVAGGNNSTTVSGGREGMLTSLARSSWHGFGDLGSSNGSPGRRGSSSGGMMLSGTATSRDFGSHLHPSISRDKLSTISDIGSSVDSSSLGVVDDHDQDGKDDILDDVDMEEAIPLTDDKLVTNVLYSWGKGIQSMHNDNTDRSIPIDDGNDGDNNAKVSSRLESKSILSIATGQNHSVCATAQGTTYVVGTNIHGCVDPNLAEGTGIYRPQLFESLSNVRVVQVSCGYDHTAALSSNGSVWTWGSNAYGQLGHRINNNGNNSARDASFEGPTRCRPTGMALGKGRRASSVACGTYYTLVLTTHMSLLACGKALIAGHREPSEFGVPKQLPTLVGLPLVGMAAGDGHAVVITAHGTAFVWGENRHSCCGREYPTELTVPLTMKLPSCQSSSGGGCGDGLNIPDEVAIQDAACGLEHTILVTRSGRLLVCGNNNFGQLGIAASELNSSNTVIPMNHPNGGRFVSAEAGIANSLILDDAGDVWMTTGQHGLQCLLASKSALAISVGGDGNFAIIAAAPTGVKLLQRQFSVEEIENPTSIVDAVHGMIVELEDGKGDKSNLSQEIARKSEELLRYPSYLNSLFVNPKQLDQLFERLLRVCSADAMQELARAFERGLKGGLDSLRDTRLIHGEAVRCLLQYILFFDIRRDESVVFDLHGETISTFCDTILSVPFEGYKALHSFATSQYTGSLFVKMLVKPLLRTLNICASYTVDENEVEHFTPSRRAVPVIVAVLSRISADPNAKM